MKTDDDELFLCTRQPFEPIPVQEKDSAGLLGAAAEGAEERILPEV